jgi:transposase
MKEDTTIGVDLAKNVFEVAVSRKVGRVSSRRRLSRVKFLEHFQQQAPSTVVMEACGSAHHWARRLREMGHRVVLLPPHQVRPFVTRNKTDRCDARALLKAYRQDDIHAVPVKTVDMQGLAALHRLRSGWLDRRRALLNSLRGTLREFGIFIPIGARHVRPKVSELVMGRDPQIPSMLYPAFERALVELESLETSMKGVEKQLLAFARLDPRAQRLRTIPGIGPLTATAWVAFVGDSHRFQSGRHAASYLGLTPREHSSGERRTLGRISKQGNRYLRTLLVHGARSVLRYACSQTEKSGPLQAWARAVAERRGKNTAAVALANKIARLAWAVTREEKSYLELRCSTEWARRPSESSAQADAYAVK